MMENLQIHFLNVGHGDCTIIDFPDHLTVMDINACKKFAAPTREELKKKYGGSYAAELAIDGEEQDLIDPVEYIKSNFAGKSIFRYIQSHPDMDHMAGLHRLVETVNIHNFWDTDNCIDKEDKATKWSNVNFDLKDWRTYQAIRKGEHPIRVLKLSNGAKGEYYANDGISIWAPWDGSEKDNPEADPNCFSYALGIDFHKCYIVLGGDLPSEKWEDLVRGNNGTLPKVNLLKASHHGRKSGYSREAVKAMRPDVTICSVGELHPKHDAAASYENYSSKGCFSTVDHGSIVATCWADGDIWLSDFSGNTFLKAFD